jgi:putative aldouronate transport system permease protein
MILFAAISIVPDRVKMKQAYQTGKKDGFISGIKKSREIYLLVLPGIVWFIIFSYIPILGLSLAFKTYKANLGIFGSPWTGLVNYTYVFRDLSFIEAIQRTFYINAGRLLFQFPVPIIFALILNEVRVHRYKKIVQTIYTFPNFLSWVIVSTIMINFLSINGVINGLIRGLGGDPVSFLGTPEIFQPMLYLTENWKSTGWNMIIYIAAIAGINAEQYESAQIDGATRMQSVWYITLPGLKNTIVVLFILAVGNLMSGGFDQIFNLSNPATARVAETLDMYIYRITFQGPADFSFSSAVSLFRSVINFCLLLMADRVCKLFGSDGLFG